MRNLSLKGSDQRPATGFDAVSTLMVATNAGESLIGRVDAFCIEKSCLGYLSSVIWARSTENDNERTSGLKSELMFESAFANRTTAGYLPGFAKIPFASRAARSGARPTVTSNISNWARTQTPLAWVPRQSDRCCFVAAFACIKRDFSAISSISDFSLAGHLSASLSVTPNHRVNTMFNFLKGDASCRYPRLEMNLIAVTLGRKQYAAARVATKLENPVTL